MLGSTDAFATGHTMEPKTFGMWIGTTVLECDEFTIVLIDTEGVGNVQAEDRNDLSILLLSVLLSSCFIYNSKEIPKKSDLREMQ